MLAQRTLLLAGLLALSCRAAAAQVYADDLVVIGNTCSGVDCVNNEAFAGDTLRLKENNLRIRLTDNTAGDVLGRHWSLTANSQRNGERNFLRIGMRELTATSDVLSDGTYPQYDCSMATTTLDCVVTGTIPAGSPVLVPASNMAPPPTIITTPIQDITSQPVYYQGNAAQNGTALGSGSEVVDGAVTLGKSGLARRLQHVAMALAATDVATAENLGAITARLDAIDAQLDSIEATVFAKEHPRKSGGLFALWPYGVLCVGLSVLVARRLGRRQAPAPANVID
jgi:hypothetical protein